MNTYFIGLTHDQTEIAAYVAWNNLAGIVFTIGLGFGIIGRRDVAHLLHHNALHDMKIAYSECADEGDLITQDLAKNLDVCKPDHTPKNASTKVDEHTKVDGHNDCHYYSLDAKNLAWFNIFQTISAGVLICILFICLRYYITLIYTQVSEVSEALEQLVIIYAFCCILEFSNASLSCLMRLTNHVCLYSTLGFGYCVLLQGVLSYVFCFILDLKAVGLLLSFAIMSCCMNFTN